MASTINPRFTTDKESISGTEVDDIFVINTSDYVSDGPIYGPFGPQILTYGDTLDGGAGNDTVRIVQSSFDEWNYLHLDLTSFASIKSIENIIIEASVQGYASLQADAQSLAGIKTIDGGGAYTYLTIEGGYIDLRGKTFININNLSIPDPAPTVVVDNAEAAVELLGSNLYFSGDATIILEGASFTDEQIQALLDHGVETIKDASGTYNWEDFEYGPHLVEYLDGDIVYSLPGQSVPLDAGQAVAIPDDMLPRSLSAYVYDQDADAPLLSIKEGVNGVSVVVTDQSTAVRILVNDNDVGTLITDPLNPSFVSIAFHDGATAADLKAVIGALEYTSPAGAAVGSQADIGLTVSHGSMDGDWTSEYHTITVMRSAAPTATLTMGANGDYPAFTTGDDVFAVLRNGLDANDSIFGGEGVDTLQMVENGTLDLRTPKFLDGIEVVRGTAGSDKIYVDAAQLAGIDTIDGGGEDDYDQLVITGDAIDLRGKTFTGIDSIELRSPFAKLTFEDADQALAFMGNLQVIQPTAEITVEGDITHAQRTEIFSTGALKITAANGTFTNLQPMLSSLDGDVISASNGNAVLLDASGNAIVSNPEGRLSILSVNLGDGFIKDAGHNLEIATSASVKLTSGMVEGGAVTVNGIQIGVIHLPYGSSPTGFSDVGFSIQFNDSASTAAVQEVVRSVAYRYAGNAPSAQMVKAFIYLAEDNYYNSVEAEVTINVAGVTPPPPPPAPVQTSYSVVTDFVLPADALTVTASGKENITITGNALSNVMVGNIGKNTINAGAGNDKVNGGLGNDVLIGGAGKDSFVFNTKLNKKTNLDKISDFNVRDDSLSLDNGIFKKLGKGSDTKPGKLNKAFFTVGANAKDADDYLIYNKKTGALFYDADGSGAKAAVQFAKLAKNLKLTASDFFVV